MRNYIIFFLTILSLSFDTNNEKSKACNLNDEKEILNLYLDSYINNEFKIKRDKIVILKESPFALSNLFLPYLEDKAVRYEKAKKACDEFRIQGSDSTFACALKSTYAKYLNLISVNEKEYFRRYLNQKGYKNYEKIIINKSVQFVDSLIFFNASLPKEVEAQSKLEFRGPFFSKDKSKAFLEVRETAIQSNTSVLMLTFVKEGKKWVKKGNVNF